MAASSWHQGLVKSVIQRRLCPQQPVVMVINRSEIRRQITSLQRAFPATALHAFAAKSNPLTAVLQIMQEEGLGCETASIGEFQQAQRVFAPNKIVFDSPVKTVEELAHSLALPCFLNVDNFDELQRVADIDASIAGGSPAVVGIRINPQVGGGDIDGLSTGRMTSKFGIGLADARSELIAAYKRHPFLRMVHVHTGSQGFHVDFMVSAIAKILEFVEEVGGSQIKYIDIGGGLSVNFKSDDITPTFQEYADALRAKVPQLFDESRFQVITEFGRALVAKAGVYLSRVEYCKTNGGRYIVSQHVGHDLIVRTVWCPKDWPLRVHIFNGATAEERTEDVVVTDVAGPCCLGGDLACKERPLPRAAPGDVVCIRDVGGYMHSSYNHYNLRNAPAVYLFDEGTAAAGDVAAGSSVRLIKRAATVEETLQFASTIDEEVPAPAA